MVLFTYVLLFNRVVIIWKSSASCSSFGVSDLYLNISNDLFLFIIYVGHSSISRLDLLLIHFMEVLFNKRNN